MPAIRRTLAATPTVARRYPPSRLRWPLMPEVEQETGRVGAKRIQRLLEATLRFKLPYDAYAHRERVMLKMLTGRVETYDLKGDYVGEDGRAVTSIYVESKNVAGAGSQSSEFRRFLAQAYSATKQVMVDMRVDPKYEFMWATTCPWKGDGFRDVASLVSLRSAVVAEVGGEVIPEGHGIDEEVLAAVKERLWVWVVSDRQEHMLISAEMRGWVVAKLEEQP